MLIDMLVGRVPFCSGPMLEPRASFLLVAAEVNWTEQQMK